VNGDVFYFFTEAMRKLAYQIGIFFGLCGSRRERPELRIYSNFCFKAIVPKRLK
jgi:hypothetical protein